MAEPLPPVPSYGGRAAEIVSGVVLIVAGAARAVPAGFCTSILIAAFVGTSSAMDAIGLRITAALGTLLGGAMIWRRCRLLLENGPIRYLFGVIVAVLIVVVFLLTMSLAASLSGSA